MEQVGPRHPLGSPKVGMLLFSQKRVTEGGFRASFFVVLWSALACVSSAHGHFSDYIFVRFSLDGERRIVGLDLWLDYQENPFIDTREEAHEILEEELIWQLEEQEGLLALSDLLPDDFAWQEVLRLPDDCPAPPAEEGEAHRFLHASLDFADQNPGPGSISLLIPTESSQAAIVWLMDRELLASDSLSVSSAEEVMMLLAGDFTPSFPFVESKTWVRGVSISGLFGFGLLGLFVLWRIARRRRLHANQ